MYLKTLENVFSIGLCGVAIMNRMIFRNEGDQFSKRLKRRCCGGGNLGDRLFVPPITAHALICQVVGARELGDVCGIWFEVSLGQGAKVVRARRVGKIE